jgi:UDP-glucose 4-epimerase
MNVGTGEGTTVQEVISYIYELGGYIETPVIKSDPRPGDPPSLSADISLIQSTIGFQAKYTIRESLKSLFLQ